MFYAWIQQGLIPKLPKNSVIVMDNVTFHKQQNIRQAIEEAGHTILWLPPYSPELNSIKAASDLVGSSAYRKVSNDYVSLLTKSYK